jgi:AcrR family transcriptional regulator
MSLNGSNRIAARRQATVDEALDHAVVISAAEGAGAVTVSEIARRLGMRAPSLYKYFPSLHAIYDAMFARGYTSLSAHVQNATATLGPGLPRLLASSEAVLRWSHDNLGLAQLMFWRPVPGFTPSSEAFAPSGAMWKRFRDDLTWAAHHGELRPDADSDEVLRLLTIVTAGVLSQQMANQPEASFDDGTFTGLADQALAMFAQQYAPPTHHRSRKGSP